MSGTHGHSAGGQRSGVYKSWQAMLARCLNPKHPQYKNYGGRGLTVAPRWLSFEAFLSDMGERPVGATLDRIDNDEGYSAGNCRWASMKVQMRNRSNNVLLTAYDRTQCLAAWAEETGIGLTTLRERLARGWSHEEVVSTSRNPRHRLLRAFGEEKPLETWAKEWSVPGSTVRLLLKQGESLEQVLTQRGNRG